MTCLEEAAYNLGYNHGWYAPTHPTVSNPAKYASDADYKRAYDAGFADGKYHKPRRDTI